MSSIDIGYWIEISDKAKIDYKRFHRALDNFVESYLISQCSSKGKISTSMYADEAKPKAASRVAKTKTSKKTSKKVAKKQR